MFRVFYLLSLNREELERQKHKKFSQTPINLCKKVCRYPPLENGSKDALLEQIFRFTFPESVAKLATLGQERQDRLQAQFYTFVLTDADGGRSYGFCLRGANYFQARIDVGQQFPECFCFITPHPHFNLFRALLSLAAAARWRNGETVLRSFTEIGVVRFLVCALTLPCLFSVGFDEIGSRRFARSAKAKFGIFSL